MVAILILVVCLGLIGRVSAWSEARELRLPGELRVVNEGLSHDDQYWYLSNQHFLYKTTVEPMTIVMSNHDAIPDELKKRRFDHIGDIDVFEGNAYYHQRVIFSEPILFAGIIYGGFESSTESIGILAKWNATDLSFIGYTETTQNGMPWVAIDPATRLLYSAVWNDCCSLQVYNVDTFEHVGVVTAPAGLPKEIQGGAFYQNDIYLAVNGNCSIYQMNVATGDISFVLSDMPYQKHIYEMEGLTFWDLTSKGLGVMHMYGNFEKVLEKGIRSYKP